MNRSPGQDAVHSALGTRIREGRLRQKLSQRAFAERLGMSFQAFQAYETGKVTISVQRLIEIAEVLGVPASSLLQEVQAASSAPPSRSPASALTLSRDERRLIEELRSIKNAKVRSQIRGLIHSLTGLGPEAASD